MTTAAAGRLMVCVQRHRYAVRTCCRVSQYVAGVTVTGDKDQDEWIRVEMLHDRMFDSPSLARMWSPRYRRVRGLHAAGFLWDK